MEHSAYIQCGNTAPKYISQTSSIRSEYFRQRDVQRSCLCSIEQTYKWLHVCLPRPATNFSYGSNQFNAYKTLYIAKGTIPQFIPINAPCKSWRWGEMFQFTRTALAQFSSIHIIILEKRKLLISWWIWWNFQNSADTPYLRIEFMFQFNCSTVNIYCWTFVSRQLSALSFYI